MEITSFSPKQLRVLTWWMHPDMRQHEGILCDGAVRSGKTLCLSLSFVLWAMATFDDTAFAICGKTLQSAERNVVYPLLKTLEKNTRYKAKYIASRRCLLVKGAKAENRFYLFGGKDEGAAARIQGITLGGVLFDEAAILPQSFVWQALARASLEKSKFWFSCNPQSPAHWFYKEWVQPAARAQKKVLYLHFTMEDNPSLSEQIKKRYQTLYSGVFYRRFVLGQWVAAQGLIYPMFDKSMVCEDKPEGEYFISVDYGTRNPFSAGLWSVGQSRAVRIGEYYYDSRACGHSLTDEEYYQQLCVLAKGRKIAYVVVDPSAASFIECIRRHGEFMVRKGDNRVLDGIRCVMGYLQNRRLQIHKSCKDFLREIALYSWDTNAQGDVPLKENDHAMDDMRYFCQSVLRRILPL